MSRRDIQIPMPEGEARAFVFTPDAGEGPWLAVLFFMDGPGIRPALFEMGERLASNGYYVLMPDLFWRMGPYPPLDVKAAFATEESRAALIAKIRGNADPEKFVADIGVYLDWLAAQPQARSQKVGVTGYCMGAAVALRAAGHYPDKVVAAGAFHGSHLATDAPNSPHLLAPQMRAKVLVAGADHDSGFDAAQKERLASALREAGVDAEVTIYPDALHGYAPPDTPVYNPEAAERHWRELLALLANTLG